MNGPTPVSPQDPHDLLLIHLYQYLVDQGHHDTANSLLHECKRQSLAQASSDSSQREFLLQWWQLLWLVQLLVNPLMNQMFHRMATAQPNPRVTPQMGPPQKTPVA
ncbi:hypothetical protein JNB11_01055 [Kocuria palustris]|nr:hypothetical protein [Kocuria palustris]